MTININKKYRTRDGREVRIYATDGADKYPVHGSIKYETGWELFTWQLDGMRTPRHEGGGDLIEVKQRIKQKVWVNVYPDHCLGAYHEKRHADEMSAPHRIGCVQVEIDIEEGEGL